VREAAWGGGLFLIAERPGVSGDGDSRSTRPYDTAAPIKRNSALSDHPLSLSIGPSSTSLTRCHQRQITTIYFGEIGELRPAYIRPRRGTTPKLGGGLDSGTGAVIAIPLAFWRAARPRLSPRAQHLRRDPAAPRRLGVGAPDLQLRATHLARSRLRDFGDSRHCHLRRFF
jgi:hypothetical protein